MEILIIVIILLLISAGLALRSMKDFKFSRDVEALILKSKIKGTIVFFKDKVEHFK